MSWACGLPKPMEGVIFSQPCLAWPVKFDSLCIERCKADGRTHDTARRQEMMSSSVCDGEGLKIRPGSKRQKSGAVTSSAAKPKPSVRV